MNDSFESSTQASPQWLVFIPQIPPKPDYFRVKVRRRLDRLGALALKNAVYVLPRTRDATEDFHWLRREIVAEGGEAMVLEAGFVAGLDDAALAAEFRVARDAEYVAVAAAARKAVTAADAEAAERLRRQLDEIVRRDHLGGEQRSAAEFAVRDLERAAAGEVPPDERSEPRPLGATWVTREHVHVDRMASAWLIRRFIDPEAQFKLVPPRGYEPAKGERRFDMFEGEYTHEGDRCTFEVLLSRFRLGDEALHAMGQIVHDIDFKDGKFAHPATHGVAAVVRGVALDHETDEARLEASRPLFDALYAELGGG